MCSVLPGEPLFLIVMSKEPWHPSSGPPGGLTLISGAGVGVGVGVGVTVAQEQQPEMLGLLVGAQASLEPQLGF